VQDHTKPGDEIKKAELYEAFKQIFLRLLDDPQIQQKMAGLLSRLLRQNRRE
jgi:CRP-like cAMP-binding protein